MPTKNPRINVTFEKNLSELLSYVASQEKKSMASLVRDLTVEALERREDYCLSKIAEKLDQTGVSSEVKTYPHNEAWE